MRSRTTCPGLGPWLVLVLAAMPVVAEMTTLGVIQAGDDEREFAGGACLQETEFLAGTSSTSSNLEIGGDAAGCNAEWATSVEFDLGGFRPELQIFSATLIVRKTGYSDESQGFFYLGVFPYTPTGAPIAMARDDLSPETTLDILYPPAANVDLSLDVTAAIQEWVAAGESRAGFLLAGVYSEVGYEDWISVGGKGHLFPPRLLVSHEGAIGIANPPWSGVKRLFR